MDKQNHPTFPYRPPNLLSLGQTDSQVVASSGKLNLRRDLRWVAKWTDKFPHNYAQVANKPISRQTFPLFHWLINDRLMDVTQLALTWLGWPNGEKLACKFDLDQSERKSSEVNASARKAWPNGVTSRPKFKLASTCDSVWPGL